MIKTVITDYKISPQSENTLISMGYRVKKIYASDGFDEPISSHPDMFMAKVGDMWFVDSCRAQVFDNSNLTAIIDREAARGKTLKYPYDVEFNCANVGKHLICKADSTSKAILVYAKACGINIIDVKQGYAKCSTCIVNDNSIITEDESIAKAAIGAGIDVLKIQKGHVLLDGYDYGFIGGCSGLLEKNLLAFNGDITKHTDYEYIKSFCSERNVDIMSLCDQKLHDIGSILRFDSGDCT